MTERDTAEGLKMSGRNDDLMASSGHTSCEGGLTSFDKTQKVKKGVHFKKTAKVILIPNRNEYVKAGLKTTLWWGGPDYARFRRCTAQELLKCMSKLCITGREAMDRLYQPIKTYPESETTTGYGCFVALQTAQHPIDLHLPIGSQSSSSYTWTLSLKQSPRASTSSAQYCTGADDDDIFCYHSHDKQKYADSQMELHHQFRCPHSIVLESILWTDQSHRRSEIKPIFDRMPS